MAGGEGHGAIGPLHGHGSAINQIDHRILDLGEAIAREDVRSVASIGRDLAALVRAHLPEGWDLERLDGNGGVNDLRGQLDFHETPSYYAAAHVLSFALYIESCPDQVNSAMARTLAAHARELSPVVLREHNLDQGARIGGAKGGKKPKRKEWAEWAGKRVANFDDLPDPENPLEYGALDIYRDGDRIVCGGDGFEDSLARSTFEKRYLSRQ